LFGKFDNYYKHLRNFIKTKQEIPIFWKPEKMNDKLKIVFENS